MQHPLRCRCGTVSGWVKEPRSANRVVCYCKDCQAFAYFLGQENQILDERGGSDVIQILPKNLSFTQGIEALKCMRLTEKGLLRWYASCCNTPIGNTLANYKISFIGLVHSCLENSDRDAAARFLRTRPGVGEHPRRQGRSKTKVQWNRHDHPLVRDDDPEGAHRRRLPANSVVSPR